MAHSKRNRTWQQQHARDPHVQLAQTEGYRSRAVYKLQEIQQRDRILRPGICVVELGAAPGSWSQWLAQTVDAGTLIALDILPMEPINGVHFIQGDFLKNATHRQLEKILADQKVDLVISDMAPNISGITCADQAHSMGLCETALHFVQHHLNPTGDFLVKVFQGEEFQEFHQTMKSFFHQVQVRKPKASRDRSREVYLLARGYHPRIGYKELGRK